MQTRTINFQLSVTTAPVYNKDEFNWGKVVYSRTDINLTRLVDKLQCSYAINSVFASSETTAKTKTKANFRQSNLIAFDFDHSPMPLESFIERLEVKPTIYYRTPNDGIKGNRFRLIYAFSEPFTSTDEYSSFYHAIRNRFFPDMDTDNSLASGVQNIGGAKHETPVECSYNIFSKHDFVPDEQPVKTAKKCPEKTLNEPEMKLINDADNLDFRKFLEKYMSRYPYFDHSELDYKNGYAIIDNNYIEIKRKWHMVAFEKRNGDTGITGEVVKIKDKMQRRKTMYIQCLLRRKMMPDVTIEHLFVNLVHEREYYFDNSDGQLDAMTLWNIASNAMNVENITISPAIDKRKFKVDKQYWEQFGINPNQAKQYVKKSLKYEEIGKYYNPELTDKQNLETLKEHGIKCSRKTLYTFKNEHGLTKFSKSPQ